VASKRIVWRRLDVVGVEWCEIESNEDGIRATGLVAVEWEGDAHRIDYEVGLDEGLRTRTVRVTDRVRDGERRLALEADGLGTWRSDAGLVALSAPEAIDVDLGFSPLTNSLPIWRFELDIGDSREIEVAWVRFPSLEVVSARQTYTRLDELRWRYASGGFEAELDVGEDGLVERYGAYWEAVARG
jgi:hypothetical protein